MRENMLRQVWCVAYRGDLQMNGYKTNRSREVYTRVEAQAMKDILAQPRGIRQEPKQDLRIQSRLVGEWEDDE